MISAIPPYLLLLVAILLIYLLDCIVLLYSNEAIVKPQESGWIVNFGTRQPWVAGKRIYLLDPLTPLVATYIAHWKFGEVLAHADEAALERCASHSRLIAGLDLRVRATAWVVLVILPIAMLLRGPLGFLIGAALSWVVVIVLLVRFHSLRRGLEMGWGEFSLIAFECLACPPCAVNLLRKLSLRYRMRIDLVELAPGMRDDQAMTVYECVGQQADARLIMMELNTPEYERARAYRELLRAEHFRLTVTEAASP